MKKDDIIKQLQMCEESIQLAKERLDTLEKENAVLRELVHHLASRPAPYIQPPQNPPIWHQGAPYKVTC
jgi:hypothetical protein